MDAWLDSLNPRTICGYGNLSLWHGCTAMKQHTEVPCLHSYAAAAVKRHTGVTHLQVFDEVGPAGGAPEGQQDGVRSGCHDHLRIHRRFTKHLRHSGRGVGCACPVMHGAISFMTVSPASINPGQQVD